MTLAFELKTRNLSIWCIRGVPDLRGPLFLGARPYGVPQNSDFFYEICACPELDVLSVPEALVHSIRILEAPAVYLKHPWLKS